MDEKIRDKFYNLDEPTAYSSAQRIKEKLKNVSVDKVRRVLAAEFPFSLHKTRRYRFKRLKTIPSGWMWDIQCDLADFRSIARENDGFAYCLVAVDVMSRQVFTIPTKSKSSKDMKRAFDILLDKKLPIRPETIFTDKGLEFESREMLAYFKKRQIAKHHGETDQVKASICERMIRSWKSRVFKFFAANNTKRWIDVADKISNAINHSHCRAIGTQPIKVTSDNWWDLWKKLYGSSTNLPIKGSSYFRENDYVRISLKQEAFDKGYHTNYTDEIFRIAKKFPSNPPTFELEDTNTEKIIGRFYKEELSLADINTAYRIEKVIRTRRGKEGHLESYVKFVGFPSRYNAWIVDE